MRPDLPWHVAGIPPEAREAARAAARREGLSMGEWLTRRILAGLSDMSEPMPREEWTSRTEDRAALSRRDSDEMLDHVSRSEAETASVYRRIEDQLRGMGRRLDSAERSQSESNRVMSKAAVEMNITAREQAQVFDQLGAHVTAIADRLERVEHNSNADGMRDAVKALHQGLARLADQIAQTANQSATQISALTGNLETVAGRVGQARHDAQTATQALEGRLVQLDERLRVVEKAAQSNATSLERALAGVEERQNAVKDGAAEAISRLEDAVSRLDARGADPALDRRLSGIERTLGDLVGRIDHDEPASADPALQKLAQRLDAAEAVNAELKKALAEKTAPAPDFPQQPFAGAQSFPPQSPFAAPYQNQDGPFSPQSSFEPPPFPDAQPAFGQPPFAEPAFAGAGFDAATGFGGDQLFAGGQAFGANGMKQATVDTYLSAARHSARAAAAQAEAENAGGVFGGLGWSKPAAAKAKPAGKPRSRTMTILIGVLALMAIAVLAAYMLNRKAEYAAPGAPTLVATKPAIQQAPPPAATTQSSEPVETLPQALPAQKQAVQTATPLAAPSSPRLPVPKVIAPQAPVPQAPQKQVAAKPAPVSPLDKLTQLANAGNVTAETVVGLKYLDGDGVPKDEKLAANWLEKAAPAGQPVAQYRLATLYERGSGVTADPAKAEHWYEAAANQGNRKAMHNLAVAYAEGAGVKKDFIEAARWFSKAADLGLSDSQFNLAVLYERGLGVPQSLIDAYKWYAIASAQGDAESRQRVEAISTQLSAEDRAAAQHAADTFKPAPMDAKANVEPTLEQVVGQ
jgi:localization factor PodJL